MWIQAKFGFLVVVEGGLLLGQTVDDGFLTANAFDKGTTVVGLGILVYMFKMVLSGDLVPKDRLNDMASKAGREAALTVLREQSHEQHDR